MMTTFILVMALVGSNGFGGERRPAITTAEFATRNSCEKAKEEYMNKIYGKMDGFSFCVQK